MGATAAAVTAAVAVAAFVVTLVLTAAVLTVVGAEVFAAAVAGSVCVDLDEDLVVVLDVVELGVSSVWFSDVSSFGVVDEPLV
ncbi:hypothetical protein [Mycolicibacterium cosmeticum]|uniref:hypothetical protein n=1 Tax=Mycolicibacterium cosmeticum TaxID=258533 RepID=UPI003204E1F6